MVEHNYIMCNFTCETLQFLINICNLRCEAQGSD